MGACENSFEPHEPLTLAATEQHSCLEFIKDSEQLPVLETAHSLIDSNVEPSSATDGFVDLSQKDNCGCVDSRELLEDESGVIGGCLDGRQSGIDDCNGETDRSREEKAGLGVKNGGPLDCERSLEMLERNCDQQDGRVDDKKTGVQGVTEEESDGLVTVEADTSDEVVPSTSFETSVESILVNDMTRNCDQQDDQNDHESGSVQGVMEEKNDGLAAIKIVNSDEIVLSLGSEMPTELMQAEDWSRNGDQQDDHRDDKNVSVQGVMEQYSSGLAPIEFDDIHDEIVLSSGQGMPAELLPEKGLPSDGNEQYKHDCGTSQEAVMEEKIDSLTGLENSDLQAVMERKSDGLVAKKTADTCENISPSLGYEMPAECLPRNGVEKGKQDRSTSMGLERTLKLMPMTGLPEESVHHDEQKLIPSELDSKAVNGLAIERVPERESDASARIEADIYAQISPHGAIDSKQCSVMTLHHHLQKGANGARKSSRKSQIKRAARKSRNTTKVRTFIQTDETENNGSQKARGGRGSRKRNNRAGGRSQRSSKKGCASASIRLKVKVGKEACQTEGNPKIMIPEVIDTKASAELVSNYGVESYQETSFEMSKLVHYAEDNVAEEGTGKQLQSFDIKLKRAELHCNPYRYTDPGTSPDSEVINLVAEGQVDARCPEDFHDAVLSSSNFATDQGGNGKRRGKKKERLPQAANCSTTAASLNKVKLAKKRRGRQRKADGLSSTEILTSSSSVNGLINTPSSKECSAEQVPLSRETELEVSGEALREEISMETKICVGGLDAELRSSGSQISKNPLPSTKSRGNGVNKGRSKVSNSAKSRRANGCKDRGNDRKSVKKNKAKGKSVCDHDFYKVDDDPEIGQEAFCSDMKYRCNHTADENGKIDAGEDTAAEEVADLDMLSSGVMEQNLSSDNAWVRCDDCLKWRRIPVRLVESISQTHCQWICKDNMNKAFADCSFPQEKSNAEINAELGISDVDEDGCDAPSNYMESECRQTSVSKEYEFTRITTNQFLHRSRKTQTIDEIMVCYCKAPVAGRLVPKRNYAKMTWERCGKKGFGLRLDEDISRGQFLIEYVGEAYWVFSDASKAKDYASKGHKHFYFMTLDGSEVIDACAKGNLGRFINHSCDPNCRTEKKAGRKPLRGLLAMFWIHFQASFVPGLPRLRLCAIDIL
ncbi:hypothetical protein POTOM_060981 [Populus tomentosa]|uniref:Histone-lysine N-methyltransferase ASHH2 n=1 Tax=Populus tomentosa TaxID=118781 RepID=A0A8X7XRB7_POPTO|nr:hypothetical protein POTOM_060981 [Populus tomentosa]